MMTRVSMLLAAFAVGFFQTAAAQASGFIYECDVGEQNRGNTWVTPKIAIIIKNDGNVSVLDGIAIAANGGKPFPARVTRNNDRKMIVRWVVEGLRDSNGLVAPRFDYNATIRKKTGRVTVVAQPENFYNSKFSGKGQCIARTG